jgi:hypothetical protein
MTMSEKSPTLPDLLQSSLDPETLHQLFVDLEACTEIIEVIPKALAADYVPERSEITLEEGREMLLGGHVRGLQIRYHYQDSQWWDTLLPEASTGGFRIVRIQHDFV